MDDLVVCDQIEIFDFDILYTPWTCERNALDSYYGMKR